MKLDTILYIYQCVHVHTQSYTYWDNAEVIKVAVS